MGFVTITAGKNGVKLDLNANATAMAGFHSALSAIPYTGTRIILSDTKDFLDIFYADGTKEQVTSAAAGLFEDPNNPGNAFADAEAMAIYLSDLVINNPTA